MGESGTERSPYDQLNDMHKLAEELRANISQLKAQLQELKQVINQHHDELFAVKDSGCKEASK